MEKAILTRYLGPTDFKGARIVAQDGDGNRVMIAYRHDLSSTDAHKAAADALCAKMKWAGSVIGGRVKNGYAWFFVPEPNQMTEQRWQCWYCDSWKFEGEFISNGKRLCKECDAKIDREMYK